MRFKECDKEAPEAASEVPDLSQQQSSERTVHHGHLDPVARSRDALYKLLGRHISSGAAAPQDSASKPARSSTTPAFEAPLSVPVFSRRREVGALFDTMHWQLFPRQLLAFLLDVLLSTGAHPIIAWMSRDLLNAF
jgi:hypothetical protein